jgi:hypothetical protein
LRRILCQGLPQAILELHLQPVAVAKAKRLGRELSIKVALQPSGSSSSCLKVLEYGEEYAISLPALLLLDPLSPACLLAFKGVAHVLLARASQRARLPLLLSSRRITPNLDAESMPLPVVSCQVSSTSAAPRAACCCH